MYLFIPIFRIVPIFCLYSTGYLYIPFRNSLKYIIIDLKSGPELVVVVSNSLTIINRLLESLLNAALNLRVPLSSAIFNNKYVVS